MLTYANGMRQEKDKLGLFAYDIGLRGVLCGYNLGKKKYRHIEDTPPTFIEYMEWYLKHINKIHASGYLDRNNDLLDQIAVNKSVDYKIINYKLNQQATRFGAYCAFFVSANEYNETKNDDWKTAALDFLETIEDKLNTSYRSVVRVKYADDLGKIPQAQHSDEVNKRARRLSQSHIKKLKKAAKINSE